jgi:hypothetical protein
VGWFTGHCGKITISGIPNSLNYFMFYSIYIFTNVAAGHIIIPGGPHAGLGLETDAVRFKN